jgi:hypothetical protein
MNWSGWFLVPVIAAVSPDSEIRHAKSFLGSR